MSAVRTGTDLAIIRYVALLAGFVGGGLAGCKFTTVASAFIISGAITIGFLFGLRWYILETLVRREQARKSLSWSTAYVGAWLASGVAAAATGTLTQYADVGCIVMTVVIFYYAIGKITCARSGCCGSARFERIFAGLSLPVLECLLALAVATALAVYLTLRSPSVSVLAIAMCYEGAERTLSRVLQGRGWLQALKADSVPSLVIGILLLCLFVR